MKHAKLVSGVGGLTIISILLIVSWTVGCGSTGLPPRISSEQRSAIAQTKFPVTVGVETYQYPAYSESLLLALRRSGLFDRVERLQDLRNPPHLIARVERQIYGTAVVPCATGLTLGVVPTTVDEEHGESFSLSLPDKPHERVAVEFSYTAPTTLGWIGLLKALSPDFTAGEAEAHPRFREGLAAKIAEKAPEIGALVQSHAPPD